jgi:hypothetical protein
MNNGGVGMAGPIWRSAMTSMLSGTQNVEFTRPSSIVDRNVCRSNGGIAIKSGSNTYNEVFMAGALPTETCNAEPVMVTVCNLTTNKVESIDETNYNDANYSKDTTKCKAEVSVCDLTSGKVVTITEDAYNDDTDRYSKTTTNCEQQASDSDASMVTVCDLQASPPEQITIQESEYQANTARYSTNLAQCS